MTYKSVERKVKAVRSFAASEGQAESLAVLEYQETALSRTSDTCETSHELAIASALIWLVQIDECGGRGHRTACNSVDKILAIGEYLLQWSGHCCGVRDGNVSVAGVVCCGKCDVK